MLHMAKRRSQRYPPFEYSTKYRLAPRCPALQVTREGQHPVARIIRWSASDLLISGPHHARWQVYCHQREQTTLIIHKSLGTSSLPRDISIRMATQVFRSRYSDQSIVLRELRSIFPNGGFQVFVSCIGSPVWNLSGCPGSTA